MELWYDSQDFPGGRAMLRWLAPALTVIWAAMARGQCGEQWLPAETIPGVVGRVFASTEWFPDGTGTGHSQLIIGGQLSRVYGIDVLGIAAWDGTYWRRLGTGISNIPSTPPSVQ